MPPEHATSDSPEETERLAGDFARRMSSGDWVGLTGPLGAGKSVWVRGLARGLGVREPVISPSYTLVNVYRGTVNLCHVDLYRVLAAEELVDLGLDTMNERETIVAVEWADRFPDLRLPFRWTVEIQRVDETRREITIRDHAAVTPGESRA